MDNFANVNMSSSLRLRFIVQIIKKKLSQVSAQL